MIIKKIRKLVLLFLLCSSFACTSMTPSSNEGTLLDDDSISIELEQLISKSSLSLTSSLAIRSDAEIFKLSPEQEIHFLEFYNAPENAIHEGHFRLYQYLSNFGDNFTYSDYTKTAQVTEQTASGNCISLAVLTSAYARLVDLNVKYQLVSRIPVYQQFGSVIFNAQHIRTVVSGKPSTIVDGVVLIPGYSIIDYYPSRYSQFEAYVSEEEFIGRYFRNLAAEALGNEENVSAFWLAKYSLEKEPENSDAINTLAIANRRYGDLDTAEQLFIYGLSNTENKLGLLKNYKILLNQQERFADVEKINAQIKRYDDENPFDLLRDANQAFTNNNLTKALSLYKSILNNAPYLHQAYFGIARVEYKRGNKIAANQAFERALEVNYDKKTESVYEAKLSALKKLSND